VRAHTSVRSNKMADQLETQAHIDNLQRATGAFTEADSFGRGAQWAQYLVSMQDGNEVQMRNASDLKQHLLDIACAALTKMILANADSSTHRKVQSFVYAKGGFMLRQPKQCGRPTHSSRGRRGWRRSSGRNAC